MSLNSDSAGERQRHGKREGRADRAAETEEKEELRGRESGGRGIQRAENRNAVGQRERDGRGEAGEEAEGWESTLSATPVFLPGESHGRRSLVGYSPWGRKGSDTTERLHFHFHLDPS